MKATEQYFHVMLAGCFRYFAKLNFIFPQVQSQPLLAQKRINNDNGRKGYNEQRVRKV